MKRLFAALLLLLLVPGATAQINSPEPFDITIPFAAGIGPESGLSLASGTVNASTRSESGTYGFFGAVGLEVMGLERACWGNNQCVTGDVGLVLEDGADGAMRFPTATTGDLTASHAATFFVDWDFGEDLRTLGLAESMVANTVGGQYAFGPIPGFRAVGIPGPDDAGIFILIDSDDTLTITLGGQPYATVGGGGGDTRVLFDGAPVVSPFAMGLAVLPFESGSQATYRAADIADAQQGLDLTRLTSALAGAEGGNASQGEAEVPEAVAGILSAAAVHLPPNATDLDTLINNGTLLRFEELQVTNPGGGGLDWQGEAALQVNDGKVVGADPLILLWPWWAYLLWALAIAAFVARKVTKAEKRHDKWDTFRLVGMLGGFAAGIVVFLLWDMETRAVWGVSLLSGAGQGVSLGIIAVVQLIPLALVGIGIGAPLQSLFKSIPMLARQGTFMGLGRVVAPFLMYLLGAGLLIDYLGFLLDKAGAALGG